MNKELENEVRPAFKLQDELNTYLARIEKLTIELLEFKIELPEFECHAILEDGRSSLSHEEDGRKILIRVDIPGIRSVKLSTLLEIQKEMGATDIKVEPDDYSRKTYLCIYIPYLSPFPD